MGARFQRLLLVAVLAAVATPSVAVEGTWQGRYFCRQGVTGVRLTIVKGTDWSANFCFCAVPENPDVPSGEFELEGTVVPGAATVKLSPRRWIHEPAGYLMIPLEISRSADGQRITGSIDAPGCRSFTLDRADDTASRPQCECRAIPVS